MKAPCRLTLGRQQRIRGSGRFREARTAGQRRVCGCFIMNWMRLDPGCQSQLGVITSRRIGSAVVRNRARRLLREAFRHQQHRLKTPVALILIARQSIVGQSFATVSAALQRGLRDAGLIDSSTPPLQCASSS